MWPATAGRKAEFNVFTKITFFNIQFHANLNYIPIHFSPKMVILKSLNLHFPILRFIISPPNSKKESWIWSFLLLFLKKMVSCYFHGGFGIIIYEFLVKCANFCYFECMNFCLIFECNSQIFRIYVVQIFIIMKKWCCSFSLVYAYVHHHYFRIWIHHFSNENSFLLKKGKKKQSTGMNWIFYLLNLGLTMEKWSKKEEIK